ncbi:MAG: hypothetical protein Q6373_012280 [Candidatus Sigynarchaeota archaeon]
MVYSPYLLLAGGCRAGYGDNVPTYEGMEECSGGVKEHPAFHRVMPT